MKQEKEELISEEESDSGLSESTESQEDSIFKSEEEEESSEGEYTYRNDSDTEIDGFKFKVIEKHTIFTSPKEEHPDKTPSKNQSSSQALFRENELKDDKSLEDFQLIP